MEMEAHRPWQCTESPSKPPEGKGLGGSYSQIRVVMKNTDLWGPEGASVENFECKFLTVLRLM